MRLRPERSLTTAMVSCALVLVSLSAGACGAARRREPLATPVALDERAERGRTVFMTSCHQCHPGGEAGLGPALNDKAFPEFLKKFQVRHGLGTMPSFSEQKISDEQLDDLMEYLKALRRARPVRTSATP
jgi:mono/diheme cytochrome c family protein